MSKKRKKNKQSSIRDGGLDWLLTLIFEAVYPFWSQHKGEIQYLPSWIGMGTGH